MIASHIGMIEYSDDSFDPWKWSRFDHMIEIVSWIDGIIILRFGWYIDSVHLMNFSIARNVRDMAATSVAKR